MDRQLSNIETRFDSIDRQQDALHGAVETLQREIRIATLEERNEKNKQMEGQVEQELAKHRNWITQLASSTNTQLTPGV